MKCEAALKPYVELRGVKLNFKKSLVEAKGKCDLVLSHVENAGTVWEIKSEKRISIDISLSKIERKFTEPPKLDIPLREFIDYVPQDNMVMYQGSMTEPGCEENVTWLVNLNANLITAE